MFQSIKVLAAGPPLASLEAGLVEVETDNAPAGLPGMFIVGLPDKAVAEAKSRVRSAIRNSGLRFPRGHVVTNLAPAGWRKSGSCFDLAIALSCLFRAKEIDENIFVGKTRNLFIGELALDGRLRPVNNIFSIALLCRENNFNLFLPFENFAEASLVRGVKLFPLRSLSEAVNCARQPEDFALLGAAQPVAAATMLAAIAGEPLAKEFDFQNIIGQEQVKRALEIAAAGCHNIFIFGPPGAGKTLLARSLPFILPPLSEQEALEVAKIYSAAGLFSATTLNQRPFRAPHHSASSLSLTGGGVWPRPGEISLAHRGVLFLDEFLEFPRTVLENLREPLESGQIAIARASGTIKFPAKFILLAAANPCPCGFCGDSVKACVCRPTQILKYRQRVSGPLLDRIDLHLNASRVAPEKIAGDFDATDSSAAIKARVVAARQRQEQRLKPEKIFVNAEMNVEQVKRFCPLDLAGRNLLLQAAGKIGLSVRAYHQVLKVSRTISDLAGEKNILAEHLAESLQYRETYLM